MIELLEINGEPPALAGEVCDDLQIQQYWYRDKLNDEANVVFLRFAGIWHRLYFDWGIIFWRITDRAPVSFEAPEIEGSFRIVDLGALLGVRGKRLDRYEMKSIEGGSQVDFVFYDGQSVSFRNVADRTSLAA